MKDYYIVSDVGGTRMRVAVFEAGEPVPCRHEVIPTHSGGEPPLDRLLDLIAKVHPTEGRLRAIALAAPGVLDPRTGYMYEAPNVQGWIDLPIADILAKKFNAPALLGNDANLAAMGEWQFGAGRGHHDLIYLTISTGIGGGVIMDDRLLLGSRGLATELGHITVDWDGPMCGCGQRGHLEAVASGPAMANWVREQLQKGEESILPLEPAPTARDISWAAGQGDALAQKALARAGRFVGRAVADYLHVFNPSIVIIGGGVSRSGPLFWDTMLATARDSVMTPAYLDGLIITQAALGDDVGLMGAYALASLTYPV
ncbi:MAG: ROK family protein [Anaerolineaceae bacterium]|nr:ROK family protein [Anaerolineaceae bacterium]